MQGLLLDLDDLDAATLTVWVNGERKGVMVRPGMTDRHGNPVAPLAGPLCWVVDVFGASVAIDGPLPAPVVTAEDLAEDERRQRELDEAGSETDDYSGDDNFGFDSDDE